MVAKIIFILVVVCFAQTVMSLRYTKGRGLSVGRLSTGRSGGTPGGGIPGGIGDCLAIEPFHTQLAQFAIEEMNQGHSLRQILGVRSQVVAGIMYHMELYVSRSGTSSEGVICEHCDVQVWHQPWVQDQEFRLHRQQCKLTCCR